MRPAHASSVLPLWQRADMDITAGIGDGRFAEGSRLPGERDLCEALGVSRVTVRKALQSLVEDGVLSTQHGRGWFVLGERRADDWPNALESFTETARRMRLTPASVPVDVAASAATLDEAERLGIAPGTPVQRIERVRTLDGVPIAYDRTLIPSAVAPHLVDADWRAASLYAELETAGVHLARAETTVEALFADARTAELLELPAGAPLLVMRQSVVDSGGRTVLISHIAYAGDRYRLRTSFVRN